MRVTISVTRVAILIRRSGHFRALSKSSRASAAHSQIVPVESRGKSLGRWGFDYCGIIAVISGTDAIPGGIIAGNGDDGRLSRTPIEYGDDSDWCCRNLCWNWLGTVSGRTRILDQAARSIGVSASFWLSVCHPSILRMVI